MVLPINLAEWLAENRHLLVPPVGNKKLFLGKDFLVMLVAGPNARTDFHFNEREEFFYQLEGEITIRVQENGHLRPVTLKAGEMFLLPGRVPHSPVRPAGSLGLVIEAIRKPGEKDGLQWYCENCNNLLYEEYFVLKDIETDFLPVFRKFNQSIELRTCARCGHAMPGDSRYL